MEFTFDDFVAVVGHSNTGDPYEVLEAWERFCATRDEYEYEATNEGFDYE